MTNENAWTALDAESKALLGQVMNDQQELDDLEAKTNTVLTRRRQRVLALRARGVSGYRLARELGVSQTTIGNICRERQT